LLEALAAGEAPGCCGRLPNWTKNAPDYATVLAELLSLLQRVALAQVLPDAVPEDGVADPEELRQLAQALPPEDVQLFHQIALLGRRDLPLMPEPRGGFEMILLRMLCFRPAAWEVATPVSPETRPVPVPTIAPASRPAPPASEVPSQATASEWGTLVGQLKLTGIAKQVAMNCALIERQGNDFRLALEPGHAQLFNKSIEDRLKAALEQQLGAPVGLRFQVGGTGEDTPARQRFQQQAERQQVAAERIAQDPHVRDMQKTFGAQIVTVHPLDESDG
jgi:DNA polymerase-3 subunit gamma/tau